MREEKAQDRKGRRTGGNGERCVRGFASRLASLLLLAACSAPAPPKPDSAPAAEAILARRLDDPALLDFIAASNRLLGAEAKPPPWRLTSLTLAALYYHPDLALARSHLAEAKAAVMTASALPNPTLTLVPPPLVFGAVVSAVLETGGKRRAREEAAEARQEAVRADLAQAAAKVASGVREAALAYWHAKRQEELAAARAKTAADLAAAMRARLAAGALSTPEYERARLDALRAASAARVAGEETLRAKEELAHAIGVPLDALDVPLAFPEFDAPPAPPAPPALSAAIAKRPEVEAAAARLAAAEEEVRLAQAGRIPNVAIEPGYNWYQGIPAYGVAPGFDVPLFDHHEGPIAEAEARRDAAAADLYALEAKLLGAGESAPARLLQLRAGWDEARRAADEGRAHLAALERAARLGGADTPSLLAARLEALGAEEEALAQQKALLEALGRYADTFGTPLFTPGFSLPDAETAPHAPLVPLTPTPLADAPPAGTPRADPP
jgi:cobalt-zinc-cadmium efflux system outer membrane protein